MHKPAIPSVPKPDEPRTRFDQAVKETLEIIGGARGGGISKLDTAATTESIVLKINEILDRLQ